MISLFSFFAAGSRPWMDTSDPPRVRAEKLMNEMTTDEKLFMFHGSPNGGYVGGVSGNTRLGIPTLRYNDGPQGFRDNAHLGTTTAFPSGLTIGATFDVSAAKLWGETMGEEFFDKGANVQLGPGMCLARVPKNGRNFEYIAGEDPYLGYIMTGPVITGIQSKNVIANAKHWVNNNQETNRQSSTKSDSADVDERTEFEMYYPPFEGAIDANVGSIMCSYNEINDHWSCENPKTLQQDLKETLGFSGWVMSDWGATHSASMNEGLDQEMPGSSYMGDKLAALVKAGTVPMSKVNDSTLRILTPMFEMKLFDINNTGQLSDNVTSVKHNQIARDLATRSTVLLQNDMGLLPLSSTKPLKLAIIGQQAESPVVHGGGSGQVVPYYTSAPLDAIKAVLGIAMSKPVPAASCKTVQLDHGFDYRNTDAQTSTGASSVDACCQACAARVSPPCNYFTWVSDTKTCWMKGSMANRVADASATSGECRKPQPTGPQCNTAGDKCVYYHDGSDAAAAAKVAASADVTIVFASTSSSEGGDRGSLNLDNGADALIDAIAASVGKAKVAVAMVQPGAVLTPWRGNVSSILASFMPGQEYGRALSDILFGTASPSARLPLTFPARENQINMTEQQWPGINKESTYSEKLEVGYRYYDAHDEIPAFAFGHGLTYSTFDYGKTLVACNKAKVSFQLTNTGHVSASEVPQLYLGFPSSAGEPPKQLKGFKQVMLKPQESVQVSFELDDRSISIWDATAHKWATQSGTFDVYVGSSSRDVRIHGTFTA
jgi:beta-glucosidase